MSTTPGVVCLEEAQRQQIATLVNNHTGIRLPPEKHQLIEGRLRKRLRELGLPDFASYCDYLSAQEAEHQEGEFEQLIDALTTNKTDFFREADHFTLLADKVLPQWQQDIGVDQRPLRIWCAGCSTGEEAYSLAMVLSEYAQQHPGFQFQILATDISHQVLRHARQAIYPHALIEVIPPQLRHKYLLRSRDSGRQEVRMTAQIRQRVQFGHLNLMDEQYQLPEKQDVIFCRNVLIYFERHVQEQVIRRLCNESRPGGVLFLGHSESIHNMQLPLTPFAPASYVIG